MSVGLLLRTLLCAAAFAGASSIGVNSAKADNTGMELAFGNTIVSSYRDGGWVRHWFDQDGSYRSHFKDGRRLTGRWSREGERLCINDIRPRMIVSRFCSRFTPVDGSRSWFVRDPLGRQVENRLVRGRAEMP